MTNLYFYCNKGDIDSGTWQIEDLQTFSKNVGVTVIIQNYGTIQDGNLELITIH